LLVDGRNQIHRESIHFAKRECESRSLNHQGSQMGNCIRRRLSAVIAAALLLTSVAGHAQQSSSAPVSSRGQQSPQRITSVEGITEYRLVNGLRVLLYPELSKPLITVNITYLVGSRQESYGETGMAHLLEHLMFKGTPTHRNIPDEISLHGAKVNGTTNVDRTNYYEILSASDANLEWALSLEADRMVNSFIAKKDLDTEMTVVRNELERGENSPTRILQERVLETAYIWHNYSHPTIGARSDVENVPIERLQAFYHTYYQPDNAVLVVAGKFDEAKALALVQQKLGAIPKPARTLPNIYTVEPVQDGEREVTLRRVGQTQVVTAAYHAPSASHPDAIALDLLADVLNQRPTGRLYKRLVETKLATGASASLMGLHDPGLVSVSATLPKDGDLQAAKTALIKVAEGIPSEPITEAELNRVRAESLNNIERALTSADRVGLYLSESIAEGDWRLLFWERDQIKKVTVADLERVAAKYLVPSNRTIGMFIPEEKPLRAEIPPVPDATAMLKDYKGEAAVAAGEQIDPTPAAIESRTKRTSTGEIKLALLEKKTRGDLVTGVLEIHFGNETALRGRTTAGSLAAGLLMTGSQKYNMTQLQDEMTRLKADLGVSGDDKHISITVRAPKENLAAALRLAAEIVQHPAYPQDQFDQLKQNLINVVTDSRHQPEAVASKAIRRYISPYQSEDSRYVATTDELLGWLRSTSLDDVKKFHHDFYGVGSGEAAFVGPFNQAELTSLLNELFGKWKSPVQYQRIPSIHKDIDGTSQSLATPDKANAVVMAAGTLEISEFDPDYPALVLGNYMLGGGFLNSRLAGRIRQHEGLSYNVGSRVEADAMDKNGSFTFSAICAPQNVPRVEKAYLEELGRVLADGFSNEEIAAAKAGLLESRQMRFADDGGIANSLAAHLYIDRDLHWDEKFEQAIQSLTSEQIKEAMKRHINPDKMIVVRAGDFSKVKS
jgi:zinc protease